MNKYLLILISFVLFLSCNEAEEKNDSKAENGSQERASFKNPLLSSGADPWVLKHKAVYYYTHTSGDKLELWKTYKMEDLKKAAPMTIWTPPEGTDYSIHIWAPELHHINGKWYMYFAATRATGDPESVDGNRRMFVLENSSDSPMNKNWKFKGQITDDTNHWAIDGTVMKMGEENYFIWSGWKTKDQNANSGVQQLYIARMDTPWSLEGSRVMISEPTFEWEKNGLVNEGPVIWRNPANEVFLFYSASGCWTDDYKIGFMSLEGKDPLNPEAWKKHEQPVFQKSQSNDVYGPGHNSFFKSPDGTEDWILYHANDNPGDGCSNKRKPRMQKIVWDENGLPVFGAPKPINTELEVPSFRKE